KQRLHDVFQLVSALSILWVVVRGDVRTKYGKAFDITTHNYPQDALLVSALSILWVVVRGDVKRFAVLRSDVLQLFLQTNSNALRIQRIRFRQDQRENVRSEPVNGIRGPQLAGHRFCRIAPRGV